MATYSGKVIGGSLNLRQSASTTATILAPIPNSTSLSVGTYSVRDWFSTSYSGKPGYVMARYIAVTSGGQTGTITTESGPLNIRQTPSANGTILYTAAKGSTLRVLDSTSISGWYQVSGSNGTGWASSQYVTIGGGNGGGTTDYSIIAMVETDRFGNGGSVTMRSGEGLNYSSVTTIASGTNVYVSTLQGEWLPAKYGSYTGYIMAKFIFTSAVYNQSDADITGYVSYNRSNAVTYAKQYATNYNNSMYEAIANNDCANFISQCLYAGGMYMNTTWNYKQPGNLTSRTTAWTGTVSLRNMLTDRKWAYRVYDKTKLKRGDLVFTYESDSSLPHVVIISRDVGSDGKIYICGHTSDQNDEERSSSISSIYYHVNDSLGIKSADWRY